MFNKLILLLSMSLLTFGAWAQSPQVALDFIDNMEVSTGIAVKVDASFESIGDDNYINSFDYEFTLDGNAQSRHVDVSTPDEDITVTTNGKFCDFTFPAGSFDATGTHSALLKITHLNGVEITKNRGSAKCDFEIRVLSPGYPRIVAIEEYTGVWCPNCPSGWVALEAMNRIFGDQVVAIAYHSSDVMTCDLADPEPVISIPYMRLNRTESVKVTNIEERIREILKVDARAKIDVTAEWATAEGTGINVTADIVSADPAEANNYRVAYAIIHNDMRGSGLSWKQHDSGRREEPNYPEWGYLGGYLWYNDVLFDGTVMTGLENSVPALEPGQEFRHTHFIDLWYHARPEVQNKQNLQVVALLVSKDNKIVNASKCDITADPSWALDGKIGGGAGTGVDTLTVQDEQDARYYNLDGTEVKDPSAQGIYLRSQNGKVTKILVK